MTTLRQPAKFIDVVLGRAPLIGARLVADQPTGYVSPIEARHNMGLAYVDLAKEEAQALSHRSLRSDLVCVAKGLASRLLAPTPGSTFVRRPFLVSAPVDNLSVAEAMDELCAHVEGPTRIFHFVHPHALNLAYDDSKLRTHLFDADGVFADGVGLRIAAKVLGVPLKNNLNGTDMLPLLCARATAEGIPVVLVGGAPGVAAECARRLCDAFPGLSIPVAHDGFLTGETLREVVSQIRSLGRAIVLVGMGTPLQESWAHAHFRNSKGLTILTVGGLFDFYSGRMPRAPQFLRDVGGEWMYRLWQEPRRMARRYLVGNPLFLMRVMVQRLLGGPARPALGALMKPPSSQSR